MEHGNSQRPHIHIGPQARLPVGLVLVVAPTQRWSRVGGVRRPCGVLGRTAFGSPNSIYLSNPKNGHEQSNSSVTSSCTSCGFLRSRLESQVGTLSPFPHCKWGFSRCTDSARLRQDSAAKDIKTGTNCGKIEVLHLQPSYGICWSHEIETLPQCKQRIHPVLNIYYYSLTG